MPEVTGYPALKGRGIYGRTGNGSDELQDALTLYSYNDIWV